MQEKSTTARLRCEFCGSDNILIQGDGEWKFRNQKCGKQTKGWIGQRPLSELLPPAFWPLQRLGQQIDPKPFPVDWRQNLTPPEIPAEPEPVPLASPVSPVKAPRRKKKRKRAAKLKAPVDNQLLRFNSKPKRDVYDVLREKGISMVLLDICLEVDRRNKNTHMQDDYEAGGAVRHRLHTLVSEVRGKMKPKKSKIIVMTKKPS